MDALIRLFLLISWLTLINTGLVGCRPTQEEFPKGATLQLVLAKNQPLKPVYFWEDSLQRQMSFELYYFDQNQIFRPLNQSPQFLINGQPLAGNSFVFPAPGQYTVSAHLNNRTSDNQLIITVSKATDYLQTVRIKAAVPWLNADSISRLPLTYELLTKQGNLLNAADYPAPQLWADGQLQPQSTFFATSKVGIRRLEATFLGVPSTVLAVTARSALHYPLTRLPVVIHVPDELSAVVEPTRLLASVNQFFRQRLAGADPNRAEAAIEFYPAPNDPQGQPLAVAGLHTLVGIGMSSTSAAQRIVAEQIKQWCPHQYINVFVGLNWIASFDAQTNYAYQPVLPAATELGPTCDEIAALNWSSNQFPAIHLAPASWVVDNGTFAHELGHFLGLPHTYQPTCGGRSMFDDVPLYVGSLRDEHGQKYSCQGAAFVADNLMDYSSGWRSFTQDQVTFMRLMLERGHYIPTRFKDTGLSRRGGLKLAALSQGSTLR